MQPFSEFQSEKFILVGNHELFCKASALLLTSFNSNGDDAFDLDTTTPAAAVAAVPTVAMTNALRIMTNNHNNHAHTHTQKHTRKYRKETRYTKTMLLQ